MQVFGKTDAGKVRNTNQDSYAFGKFGDGVVWAVVCDGMGGANGGNVASALCVESVTDSLKKGYRTNMSESSFRNLMESAISGANIKIFDKANRNQNLKGMGTTVIIAIVTENCAYFAHAGDSRAYLLTDGTLSQVTRDHSIVQTMMESGKITAEEARVHPNKNVITRALGVEETVEADYDAVDLKSGDKFLLCTDGLTNYLDNNKIFEIISLNKSETAIEKLILAANKNGGGDNITAVIITEFN